MSNEFVLTETASNTGDSDGIWLSLPKDNIELFAKFWSPPSSVPTVANVTFVHGLGEHISRYNHVFNKFANEGIRTFAFDQRGFGRSVHRNSITIEGGRPNGMVLGDNQGWDTALGDICRAVKYSKQDNVPHFLMGHSMGGLLALSTSIKCCQEMDFLSGLILSGICFIRHGRAYF
jgi:acylglycerol lipase